MPGARLSEMKINTNHFFEQNQICLKLRLQNFGHFLDLHWLCTQSCKCNPFALVDKNKQSMLAVTRVGVTEKNSSVSIISQFFGIVETLATHCISREYLAGAAMTPVRYECASQKSSNNTAKSKLYLKENLTNRALITSAPGQLSHR